MSAPVKAKYEPHVKGRCTICETQVADGEGFILDVPMQVSQVTIVKMVCRPCAGELELGMIGSRETSTPPPPVRARANGRVSK